MSKRSRLSAIAAIAAIAVAGGPIRAQIHDPRALTADPRVADGPIAPELEGRGRPSS